MLQMESQVVDFVADSGNGNAWLGCELCRAGAECMPEKGRFSRAYGTHPRGTCIPGAGSAGLFSEAPNGAWASKSAVTVTFTGWLSVARAVAR